ncbi:PREDICTED: uncharacterized protein LOC104745462 [Camelina sativa]|uniref:Uncharacterized protein LOC104730844 n=1 Tax=Camelina sativa TaxID=90675 RepID=A0ABM0W344_CAMSA|nr:PREDICTED: uncharacterized protein LOC104730844 [Camelina sativa]XP_010465012.1 PREDICTED: uncharacterized protein LOC104745462 [Camelina sativa]
MAPMIRRTIRNYATQEKYSVDFFGEELIVTVTKDRSVIGQWIHEVLSKNRFSSSHPLIVGLGVQWTPACYHRSGFRKPVRYRLGSRPPVFYPPADTLQLCVGNRCIIIQLSHYHRVPLVLRRFLKDTDLRFYGVWNSQDAKRLWASKHKLKTAELLDLKKLVVDSSGRKSLKCSKFEEIVEEGLGYAGVGEYRRESMSDWSVWKLSDDQIIQAAVDAYCAFKLGVLVGTYPSE